MRIKIKREWEEEGEERSVLSMKAHRCTFFSVFFFNFRGVLKFGTCKWFRVAQELLKPQSTLSTVSGTTTLGLASYCRTDGLSLWAERQTRSICGT